MKIRELPETTWERVSAHSHILGLGLDGLKAKPIGDGLVGQKEAREGAGLIVQMIKQGKFAGNAILLAGPPGTGKTAIATGIAKELGTDVPFMPIAGSEIYSAEVKKTEFLTQSLRKSIGARIHEFRNIYEGMVEDLSVEQQPHPYNPYTKIPAGGVVKLKASKESKKLKMDQSFAQQMTQQDVRVGDVIQIDVDGGRVVKVGMSEETAKKEKMDLTAVRSVPTPKGKVQKEKEFVYTLSLHQIDEMNTRSGMSFADLLFGGGERKEVSEEIRSSVDKRVKEWVEQGKAELLPGVLFIDECSMLDIETFAFLSRGMEQELSPIIIFATNRGVTRVRGTDVKSPHGMPLDLLDRLLVINTKKYSPEEIREIIITRAKAERIELEKETLDYLVEIASRASLRYAIQLMPPALHVAREDKKPKISKGHIKRVEKLFVDVKKSVNYLKRTEKEMIYG